MSDFATCPACHTAVQKDSSVTVTHTLSPLSASYYHPDCYDPWPEFGPAQPQVVPELLALAGRVEARRAEVDPVNAPAHYRWLPNGIEVIDITESFGFLLGNVLKYVMRADHKGRPVEDLEKARWYLDREIAKRKSSDVV